MDLESILLGKFDQTLDSMDFYATYSRTELSAEQRAAVWQCFAESLMLSALEPGEISGLTALPG